MWKVLVGGQWLPWAMQNGKEKKKKKKKNEEEKERGRSEIE